MRRYFFVFFKNTIFWRFPLRDQKYLCRLLTKPYIFVSKEFMIQLIISICCTKLHIFFQTELENFSHQLVVTSYTFLKFLKTQFFSSVSNDAIHFFFFLLLKTLKCRHRFIHRISFCLKTQDAATTTTAELVSSLILTSFSSLTVFTFAILFINFDIKDLQIW